MVCSLREVHAQPPHFHAQLTSCLPLHSSKVQLLSFPMHQPADGTHATQEAVAVRMAQCKMAWAAGCWAAEWVATPCRRKHFSGSSSTTHVYDIVEILPDIDRAVYPLHANVASMHQTNASYPCACNAAGHAAGRGLRARAEGYRRRPRCSKPRQGPRPTAGEFVQFPSRELATRLHSS